LASRRACSFCEHFPKLLVLAGGPRRRPVVCGWPLRTKGEAFEFLDETPQLAVRGEPVRLEPGGE
jgi:hypothetical protein